MTANRANWFEAFQSFVQFYPRLSATIAFGAMAAAGRMIPSTNRRSNENARQLVISAAVAKPRSTARKPVKRVARKPSKRTTSRRKAA